MARVHLTFDNGPHPEGTPQVLEVLARHGLTATFFVLGHLLETPAGLALACQIRDAGHRLGSHSHSHETPLGEDMRPDAEVVEAELARPHRLLAPIWSGPRWFRPFGGGGRRGPHLLSPASVAWLQHHGYSCVLWNCVPEDWIDADAWPARALSAINHQPPEAVVVPVLHDVLPHAMRHLDAFLGALRDGGHTFTAEVPPDCLPIAAGVPQASLAGLVAVR